MNAEREKKRHQSAEINFMLMSKLHKT